MGVLLVLSSTTYMVRSKLSLSDTQTNLITLNTFKEEVSEMALMTKSMCITDNSCDPNRANGDSAVEVSGQTIFTHFGYPIGWHQRHQTTGTLNQLLETNQFEIQPTLSNTTRAVYFLKEARQANHFQLTYQLYPFNQKQIMTITTESSGC